MEGFVGKALDAITLSAVRNGSDGEFTEGLTDNYQKLYLRGRHGANRWIRVEVEGVEDGACVGRVGTAGEVVSGSVMTNIE